MEHPEGDARTAAADDADEVRPATLQEFGPPAASGASHRLELFSDLALPVTVELGRVSLRIRDLLATGPGSVITLDRAVNEPVDILAGDRLIARGEVVVVGQSIGVRVTELIHGRDKEVDRDDAGDKDASTI